MLHHLRFTLVLGVGLVLLAGCTDGGPPRVAVSGKVTYKGKALPVGTVTFVGTTTNIVENAPIVEGMYTLARAPVDKVQIAVQTPTAPGGAQQKQKVEGKSFGGAEVKIVSIPDRFRVPEESGLTYTVTREPTQTHDLELK